MMSDCIVIGAPRHERGLVEKNKKRSSLRQCSFLTQAGLPHLKQYQSPYSRKPVRSDDKEKASGKESLIEDPQEEGPERF